MVVHEDRADEVLMLKSDKHPCVTLALIASMPRVFEAVQDKCITKANCKKDSKSFYVSDIIYLFIYRLHFHSFISMKVFILEIFHWKTMNK